MGSVKDLITPNSIDFIATKYMMDKAWLEMAAGRYIEPTDFQFGIGAWATGGSYSVLDLKKLLGESHIVNKPEALAMTTGAAFEHLADRHPELPMCYLGMLDHDGNVVDVQTLLKRGELSNIVMMQIAHVPETFIPGEMDEKMRLESYRKHFQAGALQCCVADIESIFRLGFPLGSSTFEKIFAATGFDLGGKNGEKNYTVWYNSLATYDETAEALDELRATVENGGGNGDFPKLEKVLRRYGLDSIPNPGFVLKKPVYDSTTKFEKAGDRAITKEEERKLSALSDEGYDLWVNDYHPTITGTEIAFCEAAGLFDIDGKKEVASYRGRPVLTDYVCNPDENRLMILVDVEGEEWAIPSNKEIGRAVFRKEGVASAKKEAVERADKAGNPDNWQEYFPQVCSEKNIDVKAVSDYACELMSHAVGEVANRILGKTVFDVKPLSVWAPSFMPYASKIERQE